MQNFVKHKDDEWIGSCEDLRSVYILPFIKNADVSEYIVKLRTYTNYTMFRTYTNYTMSIKSFRTRAAAEVFATKLINMLNEEA